MGPEIFAEPTGSTAGIDADALMGQIESGGDVAPQGGTPTEMMPPDASLKPGEGAAPPTSPEIEFNWNGKNIKVPANDPRIRQWAAQGYDYSQRVAMLKQQQEEFQAQAKAFEPYKQIDEYVKSNPDWWSHVQDSWAQAQAKRDAATPGSQAEADANAQMAEIEKHPIIQQFKSFMEQQQAEKVAHQRAEEDKVLTGEIQSIRDQYKDLDWDSPDQEGYSLEQRVLKHAVENGIKNFRAAFRDYNHDRLVKLAEQRAMEQVTKDAQKRTKLGLLGQTQAPLKQIQAAEDVKNKSWDDLLKEAQEELASFGNAS